ncbi:transposase [Parafrankia elaeagni]|uniref:transposase n=1 Tax=Parafrankia elaeagni TaxID=222534 RepID=UPI000370BEED|nr:transposase [Parafrankia elaeagni]
MATFGKDIPELVTLATTLDQWRNETGHVVLLGITHAKAEGVNRLTKLAYQVTFGLHNVTYQQRRANWTTSHAAPAHTDYLASPPALRPHDQPAPHPHETQRAIFV